MKTSTLRLSLILTFGAVLLAAAGANAIPQTITYQGLLSEDGDLVTGTRSVTFGIYSASTGGTLLWEEVQSVEFDNGAFGVILGSVTPISTSVFDGARKWLSVTIAGGSELLPRPEIVSVGYAFYSESAGDAATLDGRESWEYAGSTHSHDSRYFTQSTLTTTDGDPPNTGSNLVHWDLLNGVPTGFADGVDDTGAGITDHGQLSGLSDDDHPQYARETLLETSDGNAPNTGSNQVHWNNLTGMPEDFADGVDDTAEGGAIDHGGLAGLEDDDHPQYAQETVLQTSDGNAPNEGTNQVHWNNLGGVPAGFADGDDAITTNASLITTGSMAPQRITGTAVTESDGRLLTAAEKDSLTSGGITELHHHTEIGDISSVATGQGLSGGGMDGAVTVSHATDASALPNAHHPAPIVAHKWDEDYIGGSDNDDMETITSLTIDVPDSGYLHIVFSGMQVLDLYDAGPDWEGARYIAEYGVAVDQASNFDYFVRSSMFDTDPDAVDRVFDPYLPQVPVSGATVQQVDAGSHTVYLLTDVVHRYETEAENKFFNPSLVVTYFPFGSSAGPVSAPPGGIDAQPLETNPGQQSR